MTSEDDPLTSLAKRALRGDQPALERLCKELQGPLFRLALRVLGQPADASDSTQEILVQIVTHLSQYRGESRVLTWAYAVATRHLLRAKKKLSREQSVEALEGYIREGLAITEPASAPEGDAQVLERETRFGCTTAMLQVLSVEERVAVVLAEMLGASDELGAQLCAVAPAVYRKRLSRARGKLRPILEELCGLVRADAPCSCTRQARAKQLAGRSASATPTLPLVAEGEVQRAREAFGALRRLGPVFALKPLVAPPADLWQELRRKLPSVLGEEAQ